MGLLVTAAVVTAQGGWACLTRVVDDNTRHSLAMSQIAVAWCSPLPGPPRQLRPNACGGRTTLERLARYPSYDDRCRFPLVTILPSALHREAGHVWRGLVRIPHPFRIDRAALDDDGTSLAEQNVTAVPDPSGSRTAWLCMPFSPSKPRACLRPRYPHPIAPLSSDAVFTPRSPSKGDSTCSLPARLSRLGRMASGDSDDAGPCDV